MRLYALCLGLLLAATAQAEVFETTLSNGLKVVVKEDHRAPTVVQQICITPAVWMSAPASPGWRMCWNT